MENIHLDADFIEQALQSKRAVYTEFDGLRYLQFTSNFKGIRRGTAVIGGVVVVGYPSIGRVLSLQSGLQAQFQQPIWLEEKIDGFNVRIFKIDNTLVALTRGGFLCPFSADRASDFFDTSVFDEEPDLVLCAEVAGPDNPYMDSGPPFIEEDVRLFVFDMARFNQERFLPQQEKLHLLEKYRLPGARVFGRFELQQLPEIKTVLLQLNEEFREGVVFKEDSQRNHRAKYTTANVNILDIQAGAYAMLDYPPEYFKNRILRLVMFMDEQGLAATEDLRQQIGAAYVNGLFEAIEQIHAHHKVVRTFRCRFNQRDSAQNLLKRLQQTSGHVQITLRHLTEENNYWLLEFDRQYPKSSGTLSSLFSGGLMFD